MNILPKTLPVRLSLTFWFLIFLSFGVEFLVLFYLWTEVGHEHTQRLNWHLAEHLARELDADIDSYARGQTAESLRTVFRKQVFTKPDVDLYLLDSQGTVLLSTYSEFESHVQVEVKVLEQFLTSAPSRELPLYIADPSDSKRKRPFSVARVSLGSDDGYLFVLLGGWRSTIYDNALRNWYLIWVGSSVALALACAIGLLGTWWFFLITRRFRKITGAVGKLAEGEYQTRIQLEGDDEVALLGKQVDEMAATITEQIDVISEGDRLRRELVANISHDLRGPVTSVHTYLETMLLKYDRLDESEKKECLERMFRNVKMLDKLIDELFELSSLNAKEKKPAFEHFSIVDVVTEEILPAYSTIAEEHSVSLKTNLPEDVCLVNADLNMIFRVLANLVENAIYHNPADGEIVISVQERGETIHVSVADTGPGIEAENIERIFDSFYTSDKARTKGRTGTGLGLAIVKRIIELHNQKIAVESVVGEGTTFSFSLEAVQ